MRLSDKDTVCPAGCARRCGASSSAWKLPGRRSCDRLGTRSTPPRKIYMPSKTAQLLQEGLEGEIYVDKPRAPTIVVSPRRRSRDDEPPANEPSTSTAADFGLSLADTTAGQVQPGATSGSLSYSQVVSSPPSSPPTLVGSPTKLRRRVSFASAGRQLELIGEQPALTEAPSFGARRQAVLLAVMCATLCVMGYFMAEASLLAV